MTIPADAVQGCVLQPTYRIERDRPVVHLFGRLDDGNTFLIRDDRQRPSFWIRADDERRGQSKKKGRRLACFLKAPL